MNTAMNSMMLIAAWMAGLFIIIIFVLSAVAWVVWTVLSVAKVELEYQWEMHKLRSYMKKGRR